MMWDDVPDSARLLQSHMCLDSLVTKEFNEEARGREITNIFKSKGLPPYVCSIMTPKQGSKGQGGYPAPPCISGVLWRP